MRRREFVTLIGGAAAAWPLAAHAQQPQMPVIGYLYAGSADANPLREVAFRKGLAETGYIEGHNVAIEYRFGDSRDERLPALVADLVRRRVNVHRSGRRQRRRGAGDQSRDNDASDRVRHG